VSDRYRLAWQSARRRAATNAAEAAANQETADFWRRHTEGIRRDMHLAERDAYKAWRQSRRAEQRVNAAKTYADDLAQSSVPQYRKAGRDLLQLLEGT
jgi:hypothetical protein